MKVALWGCSSSFSWPHFSEAVSFLVWFLPERIDWRRFPSCLVHLGDGRLAIGGLVPELDKRPGRTVARSPRAVPWEITLPWAPTTLNQSALAVPERDDRARGSACAKAAGASISRDVGTSVTVKIRNACVKSAAGRRRSGRPDAAWMPQPKLSTPRLNARVASEPNPHRKHQRVRRLRRRVVTQQNFFSTPLCARPGCHEPPLNSIRNPARYCCIACRQAVRNVLDRERKWRSRGRLNGRRKRAHEYRAAREQRSRGQRDASGAAPSGLPPPC